MNRKATTERGAERYYLSLLTRGEPTMEDRIAARMLAAMRASNGSYVSSESDTTEMSEDENLPPL